MVFFRYIVFILGFVCLQRGLNAQNDSPDNVLFVGNSYTYFWNLPQTVAEMAAEKGIEMKTRQSTAGGVHWGQHWRSENGLVTKELIKKGKFDAVILQNHSLSAFQRADSLLYFGELFDELIEKNKGQTYLYLTWAREFDPYMQEGITNRYISLAKKINAQIVPVGPAWEKARQLRPGLPLYADDGSHPSPLGTYRSACVFFGVLTHQSPVGLPPRIITTDKDGEKIYLNIQSGGDALFCQKVAEDILENFKY